MTKENENELVHLIDTLFKNSFIGARPLALTGNQPGVGKTMLPFIRQQINLIFKKKKDFFFKKKKNVIAKNFFYYSLLFIVCIN